MECFHIDESGYTGFDLLNAEQRFQGATAVAISDTPMAFKRTEFNNMASRIPNGGY